MRLKSLTDAAEWAWMQKQCLPLRCEDSQGIVAYDDNSKIVAMAVFDGFTVDSCHAHVAITNPLVIRNGFLHEVFCRLFYTCGLKRVFGLVPTIRTTGTSGHGLGHGVKSEETQLGITVI